VMQATDALAVCEQWPGFMPGLRCLGGWCSSCDPTEA
jgi:hypothetical protein